MCTPHIGVHAHVCAVVYLGCAVVYLGCGGIGPCQGPCHRWDADVQQFFAKDGEMLNLKNNLNVNQFQII